MNEAVRTAKARTADTPELAALKHDLLCAFHVLHRAGQGSGVAGHLTARLPGAQTFWTHRWGMAFEEVGAQAISYTTGVPAVTAAVLVARGAWRPDTMVHVEDLDPDPFLRLMPKAGIGWEAIDLPVEGGWPDWQVARQ